jgi:hypothetical protein
MQAHGRYGPARQLTEAFAVFHMLQASRSSSGKGILDLGTIQDGE